MSSPRSSIAPLLRNRFEIWGDGEIVRDFIHVSDVVAALVASANYDGDASVVNVGSGVGISINDAIARVESVLGLSAINVIRTPSRAADVPVSVLDISRAMEEFDWRPVVTLERGILDTAAWMRNASG